MTIQLIVTLHDDKLEGIVTAQACCGHAVQSNDMLYAIKMAVEIAQAIHQERDDAATLAQATIDKAATGPLH